jgi:hypothetical protein
LQGKSNKQIALDLEISQRTVEFHLSNIYTKLNVGSRTESILKLTEGELRKTAVPVQVDSTVDTSSDSTDNGFKTMLRRIPVKKLLISLAFLAAVLVLVSFLVLPQLLPGSEEPSGTELTPVTAVLMVTAAPPTATMTEPPAPTPTAPVVQQALPVIPSHTVNGYTAEVVSYYADMSSILFQVRLTSDTKALWKDYVPGAPNLFNEYGQMQNASSGYGPAIDPSLIQFGFGPAPLLQGDSVKGQFSFDLLNPADFNEIYATFNFDFEIPIVEETRFQPKQTVTANGLPMLLDSVATRPGFTHVYVCIRPPSYALWTVGNNTTLRMGGLEAPLYKAGALFDSYTGSYWGIQSEPYWIPPTKTENCYKLGFEIGSQEPTSFTLTIPTLENHLIDKEPDVFLPDVIATNYPGLNARDAYYTYLEEIGNTIKGPWIFEITVTP